MSTLRRADHDAKTNTAPCCAAAPTVTASGVTGAVHARVGESARPRRVDKLREGVELHVEAPKGAIPPSLVDALRANKADLLAILPVRTVALSDREPTA